LGLIASAQGHHERALSIWKTTVAHQRAILKDDDHMDIAMTLEAIGSSYHPLRRWKKARAFLEGALDILVKAKRRRKASIMMARIQSRLAVVLLELNETKQAKRSLDKALKIYQSHNLPMDDMALQSQASLEQQQPTHPTRATASTFGVIEK
jgi:tetratricopeptide (TPR) repeat protein